MTTLLDNISMIIRTDSYKVSHWLQYPEGTEKVVSYFESRGGQTTELEFFGLTPILMDYLSKPITKQDIDEAEELFELHFGNKEIFNRAGWEKILKVYNGYIPVRIKALPEGTVIAPHNALIVVEGLDDELPWVTNYIETLLVQVWYPITVATISRNIKKTILEFLNRTGTPELIDFKLHDFGYRGVSSQESAAIGGMAHLTNFKGTDTMIALVAANRYYKEKMAGFSVPAAEHSTVIIFGETKEYEAYENMIKKFGKYPFYAVVSDSYDIFNACENIWGKQLYGKVMNAPGTLVVRPDSGIPHEIVLKVTEILGSKFGFSVNDKGFKVLNKVRVIQGDGIDHDEIYRILNVLESNGWSADNVTFGMGGALLQKLDRDTFKFAFKACSATVNGSIRDIFKNPVTDTGKKSKSGRLKVIIEDGEYKTVSIHTPGHDVLQTVWECGKLLIVPTFSEIRERSNVK